MAATRTSAQGVTLLLDRWRAGDREALERLVTLVEPEFKRMARARAARLRMRLRQHKIEPSLDTVGLISELYLRLMSHAGTWKDRAHFFAVAALRMRAISVDYARRALAAKRGGRAGERPVDPEPRREVDTVDILALEQALDRLEALDPRQARLVVLRFYGGLKDREIGEVLKLSQATVRRDWRSARAWLYQALGGAGAGDTA